MCLSLSNHYKLYIQLPSLLSKLLSNKTTIMLIKVSSPSLPKLAESIRKALPSEATFLRENYLQQFKKPRTYQALMRQAAQALVDSYTPDRPKAFKVNGSFKVFSLEDAVSGEHKLRLRLHRYLDRHKEPLHGHNWHTSSLVKGGQLVNTPYVEASKDTPNAQPFFEAAITKQSEVPNGKNPVKVIPLDKIKYLLKDTAQRFSAGDSYSLKAPGIHEIETVGKTTTLFVRHETHETQGLGAAYSKTPLEPQGFPSQPLSLGDAVSELLTHLQELGTPSKDVSCAIPLKQRIARVFNCFKPSSS